MILLNDKGFRFGGTLVPVLPMERVFGAEEAMYWGRLKHFLLVIWPRSVCVGQMFQ